MFNRLHINITVLQLTTNNTKKKMINIIQRLDWLGKNKDVKKNSSSYQ